MLFDFRGLDWDGKWGRRSFWLRDILYDPSKGKIYIRSHLGRKAREYPFLKNYHNAGIKEFIHECIRSQGHAIEKYVDGQYHPHNMYGSFKDFVEIPSSTMRMAERENETRGSMLVLFQDHSIPLRPSGGFIELDWNNTYEATLAERISIRNTFMRKVEYLSVEI